MTPSKPYLIRAIYEWIVDNGFTPYVSINTTDPRVDVPKNYIKNNMIVFDISETATQNLLINNEAITFRARFNGEAQNIYTPISSVIAIYSPENNQGMAFPKEEEQPTAISSPTPDKKPALKIITGEKDQTS